MEDIQRDIYLDNAATTIIYPAVYDAMRPFLKKQYGNPSSKYSLGENAKYAIEYARQTIAEAINASADEIYFTSGGSEANNWVIQKLRSKFSFRPMHVISSEIEHHSILEALKGRDTYDENFEYDLVAPSSSGIISVDSVRDCNKLNTELVSIQMVNNELGTIQPIHELGDFCEDNSIFLHTDAVQAFGHVDIDVQKDHISFLSASAHKIHGPKGVGFLYISNEAKHRMRPLIYGGQQERGLRASTENVASIVGFGKATELAMKKLRCKSETDIQIWHYLIDSLKEMPGVYINGDTNMMVPRYANIRIAGIRAEELIELLNSVNIFVSSGSACNSESGQPSHVLKAIGLTDDEANSSIRISLSDAKFEEIKTFLIYLQNFISILRER